MTQCGGTCAPNFPLCIAQGADFYQAIYYKDPDTGLPINLTGYTAKMQIRTSTTAEDAILTLTTENGGIVINGTAGLITIFISHSSLAPLVTPIVAEYDLFLTSGAGAPSKILSGPVMISKPVTHD